MPAYPSAITFTPFAKPDHVIPVRVPGSKSITNRAQLIAALAGGESLLIGALDADDTRYMSGALRALGAAVKHDTHHEMMIGGVGGNFRAPIETLFIGNSGTAIRFLTAAACYAPAGATVTLDGIARMRERPIADLLAALAALGVDAKSSGGNGCPPVKVKGGGLPGGACQLAGGTSSQYLSALLMAAPLAKKDVDITITGDLVSKPYVDLTIAVMRDFGASVVAEGHTKFHVAAQQKYAGRVYEIEPDASNVTYFLAAAALTGATVFVSGLGRASMQGDAKFHEVLSAMGCEVSVDADSIRVTGPETLAPLDIDLTAMPDTAQTAAVLAAFADGVSRIRGLATLRVKETDRLAAMATELAKLGAKVDFDDESWTITPPDWPAAASIATYDDHRMAMAFAVAGLRIPELVIEDPGCVAKTFPTFWELWNEAFKNVHPV